MKLPKFEPTLTLTPQQVARIKELLPTFRLVEGITGVPWEAIAAIWYRESFSVTPPKTPGGPFQFDPVPSDATLLSLLSKYTKLTSAEKAHIVSKGVNDFKAGAILAACFLRNKTKPVINPLVEDWVIQDALYGYNGRKYGSVEKSPYVMNGFNKDFEKMRLRGTIPDGNGGRKWVDILDRRPGAFTVYKQLKELGL